MNIADAISSDLSLVFKGWTPWLILPLAALTTAFCVRLYRKETTPLDKAGQLLRILRGTALVLMVLLLSQPIVHHAQRVIEAPTFVVLRDTSASMQIRDENEPGEATVRAAVALGLLPESARETRADLVAEKMKTAQGQVDAAHNAVRAAAQQSAGSNVGNALADRLRDARKFLNDSRSPLDEALAALKALKLPQGVTAQRITDRLQRATEAAARFDKELNDLASAPRDVQRLLTASQQALKAHSEDLQRLAQDTRQLQDNLDRALTRSTDANTKEALATVRKMSRGERVSALIEKRLKTELNERARIVVYDFDTDLRLASASKDGSKSPEASADPARNDTDLATPLLRLAERHAQDSLAAVLMFSDGGHTTGPQPEDAARALSGRGVPVFAAGIGSADAPRDVCVARLDGTLSVFLEETIRLTASIKTFGYKGQKLKLVLKRGNDVLQRREISIEENGWLRETFELSAAVAGANVFTLSAEPLPREATNENNSAEAVVDVAADKLKALAVDEWPRWETRYVCSLLRRERKVDLAERWLQSGPPNRPALPEDDKTLNSYDAIVVGDIGPDRLDDEAQRRLARFVSDRGGFVIFIAGPKSMPLAYSAGPISELLPVRPQPISGNAAPLLSADFARQARVKLDTGGVHSDITAVLRDPVLNEQLWPALPELQWLVRPAFAKPGAQSLLVTADAREDCVAAHQHFGVGRVFYAGSDEFWRWRLNVADRIHSVFWSQALRWGTSTRLTGGERLKVGAGRRQIRPGESVELLARPLSADGKSAPTITVVAEFETSDRKQRVQLQAVPSSGGLYRGIMPAIPAGIHTLRIMAEGSGYTATSETVQVLARESAGQEGVELSRQNARLAGIAAAGGGRALDWLEAPALLRDLSGQQRERMIETSYTLWASYPMLLLIAGLLIAEWILRKRSGLM